MENTLDPQFSFFLWGDLRQINQSRQTKITPLLSGFEAIGNAKPKAEIASEKPVIQDRSNDQARELKWVSQPAQERSDKSVKNESSRDRKIPEP